MRGNRDAWWARLRFAAAVVIGLLVFLRVALPFSMRPGTLGVNQVEHTPRLSSAGMPTRAQLGAVGRAGFGAVVNLAPADAIGVLADEREIVERSGIRYVHVPIDFTSPKPADYERFAGAMRELGDRRVFVHCQLNMRASSLVFLYRAIALGEGVDRAYDDVARVWQPSAAWRAFMANTLLEHGMTLPLELEPA